MKILYCKAEYLLGQGLMPCLEPLVCSLTITIKFRVTLSIYTRKQQKAIGFWFIYLLYISILEIFLFANVVYLFIYLGFSISFNMFIVFSIKVITSSVRLIPRHLSFVAILNVVYISICCSYIEMKFCALTLYPAMLLSSPANDSNV